MLRSTTSSPTNRPSCTSVAGSDAAAVPFDFLLKEGRRHLLEGAEESLLSPSLLLLPNENARDSRDRAVLLFDRGLCASLSGIGICGRRGTAFTSARGCSSSAPAAALMGPLELLAEAATSRREHNHQASHSSHHPHENGFTRYEFPAVNDRHNPPERATRSNTVRASRYETSQLGRKHGYAGVLVPKSSR